MGKWSPSGRRTVGPPRGAIATFTAPLPVAVTASAKVAVAVKLSTTVAVVALTPAVLAVALTVARVPVAVAIHPEDRRLRGVPRTQVVAVQRMHRPIPRHGAARRQQGLRGDLATVEREGVVEDRARPVEVAVEFFEIQQLEKRRAGGRHPPLVSDHPRTVVHDTSPRL